MAKKNLWREDYYYYYSLRYSHYFCYFVNWVYLLPTMKSCQHQRVSRYIIWGVNQFSICGGKDAPYLNSVAAQSLFWYKWHIGDNDHNIFNLDKPIVNSLPYLGSKGKPRSARRARKPLQDNWPKTPVGKWLRCTYTKCGFKWQYFGGRNWAECPLCHSTMKVAIAKRNYYTLANKEWIFVLC